MLALTRVAQVDGAWSCKAKGHEFDAPSGHMPGLQVQSQLGVGNRGNQLIFLPLSFSLPSPFSKNKEIFLNKKTNALL